MKRILCKALALVTIITSVSCPVFASENGGQTHDDVIIIREDVNHDEAASDLTYNPYIAETLIPCGTISGNVNESEINPDVQLRTEEEIAAMSDITFLISASSVSADFFRAIVRYLPVHERLAGS